LVLAHRPPKKKVGGLFLHNPKEKTFKLLLPPKEQKLQMTLALFFISVFRREKEKWKKHVSGSAYYKNIVPLPVFHL
jgi:hypothetical protein